MEHIQKEKVWDHFSLAKQLGHFPGICKTSVWVLETSVLLLGKGGVESWFLLSQVIGVIQQSGCWLWCIMRDLSQLACFHEKVERSQLCLSGNRKNLEMSKKKRESISYHVMLRRWVSTSILHPGYWVYFLAGGGWVFFF